MGEKRFLPLYPKGVKEKDVIVLAQVTHLDIFIMGYNYWGCLSTYNCYE